MSPAYNTNATNKVNFSISKNRNDWEHFVVSLDSKKSDKSPKFLPKYPFILLIFAQLSFFLFQINNFQNFLVCFIILSFLQIFYLTFRKASASLDTPTVSFDLFQYLSVQGGHWTVDSVVGIWDGTYIVKLGRWFGVSSWNASDWLFH